jgi:hypothetical protein
MARLAECYFATMCTYRVSATHGMLEVVVLSTIQTVALLKYSAYVEAAAVVVLARNISTAKLYRCSKINLRCRSRLDCDGLRGSIARAELYCISIAIRPW